MVKKPPQIAEPMKTNTQEKLGKPNSVTNLGEREREREREREKERERETGGGGGRFGNVALFQDEAEAHERLLAQRPGRRGQLEAADEAAHQFPPLLLLLLLLLLEQWCSSSTGEKWFHFDVGKNWFKLGQTRPNFYYCCGFVQIVKLGETREKNARHREKV